MHRKNTQTDVRCKAWTRLALLIPLLGTIGLAACGEKEKGPGMQPNAGQPTTPKTTDVKPTVAGAKLTAKAATASKTEAGSDPMHAFDGDPSTVWTAGEGAPQWIQLDLGEPTAITTVVLSTNQAPDGFTSHQVFGGKTADSLKLLGTLRGNTQDDQWLQLKVSANDVRYLKVLTTESPSWISWREIEVYK